MNNVITYQYAGNTSNTYTTTGKGKARITYLNGGSASDDNACTVSGIGIDGSALNTHVALGHYFGQLSLELSFNNSISFTLKGTNSSANVLVQFETE